MRLRQTFSAIMTMTLEILFTLHRLSVTEASSNDTGVYTCTGPTVGLLIFGDDMFNNIGNDIDNDIGNDIGNLMMILVGIMLMVMVMTQECTHALGQR